MLSPGNKVLLVSKPHIDCISAICKECAAFKAQILFRFTIGSVDNSILGFWEPKAPVFEERIAALIHAYKAGFQTSISCEPMLDGNIGAVIDQTREFVTNAIWLGKVNRLRQIISINCPGDSVVRKHADELISIQNDEAIHKLYERYRTDSKIKWKESIKKVVGLKLAPEPGLDV